MIGLDPLLTYFQSMADVRVRYEDIRRVWLLQIAQKRAMMHCGSDHGWLRPEMSRGTSRTKGVQHDSAKPLVP